MWSQFLQGKEEMDGGKGRKENSRQRERMRIPMAMGDEEHLSDAADPASGTEGRQRAGKRKTGSICKSRPTPRKAYQARTF